MGEASPSSAASAGEKREEAKKKKEGISTGAVEGTGDLSWITRVGDAF